MNITESIKFDKLKAENETLKKELAEKDKEIMELKNWIQNGSCHQHIKKFIDDLEEANETLKKEITELKEQQLYKEDFNKIANTSFSSKGHTSFTTWELKDNSKYGKLPSKEDKTCI